MREIAERLSSNFCDGVAVVVVDRPFGLRELTAALGCVPGMPFLPCGTANAFSWLAERDMLLVLDGTDRLAPQTLAWLRNLLTAAPGLRILAAGPAPLAFEGNACTASDREPARHPPRRQPGQPWCLRRIRFSSRGTGNAAPARPRRPRAAGPAAGTRRHPGTGPGGGT